MGIFGSLFGSKSHSVVVVEDDVSLRRFLAEQLTARGMEVFETGDGVQAGQVIAEKHPDCVILDVMLPGKNGMQVLAELRAVDQSTPVVVLTTLSGEGGLRIEAHKHNAVFLNKADTALEVVVDMVEQQIGKR